MYYYIKGEYITHTDSFIVVEAYGVGYKIFTSAIDIEKLPPIGSEVTIYTHLIVREDVQDLYGFLTNDEITMFLQLIGVSGVGPKAALAVMSVLSYEQLALAIMTNDTRSITKAQGVGPKVAQRIVLELKDKIQTVDALPEEIKTETIEGANNRAEAVTALTVLGYTAGEAKKAVSSIDSSLDVEDIIKEALKILMKQV